MIKRQLTHMGMIIVVYACATMLLSLIVASFAHADEYLGRIGRNPYCVDCTANRYSLLMNPYYPYSLTNPFGPYGSWWSPYSFRNRYSVDTPKLYGTQPGSSDDTPTDGTYAGDNSYASSPLDSEYSSDYQ